MNPAIARLWNLLLASLLLSIPDLWGEDTQWNSSLRAIKKLSDSGDHEAAAIDTWTLLQSLDESVHPFNASHIIAQIHPDTLAALSLQLQPDAGDESAKWTDYAWICELTGNERERLKALDTALRQDPDNPAVIASIAFAPACPTDRAKQLLWTEGAGHLYFNAEAERKSGLVLMAASPDACIGFAERLALWLNEPDPDRLDQFELDWVNSFAKTYFHHLDKQSLPSLIRGGKVKDRGHETSRAETARALAKAMVRRRQTADVGFRLLAGWRWSAIADSELDQLAREALTNMPPPSPRILRNQAPGHKLNFETILRRSSAWHHLANRLAAGADSKALVPGPFLDDLADSKPGEARLLREVLAIENLDSATRVLTDPDLRRIYPDAKEAILAEARRRARVISKERILETTTALKEYPNGPPADRGARSAVLELSKLAIVLAARTPDQETIDQTLNLVRLKLFGETPDWLAAGEQTRTTLEELALPLVDPKLDAVARQRATASFFRIGLPWCQEYGELFAHFDDLTPVEMVSVLEESGALASLPKWTPPGGWRFRTTEDGEEVLGASMVLHKVPLYRTREERRLIFDLLRSREEQTFGTLATITWLSEEQDRSKYLLKAFSKEAEEIPSLPEPFREFVHTAAKWLPEEERGRLPRDLFDQLKHEQQLEAYELYKRIEELVEAMRTDDSWNAASAFDQFPDLIAEVARFSPAKAAALFDQIDALQLTRIEKGNAPGFRHRETRYFVASRDEAFRQVLEQLHKNAPVGAAPALLHEIRKTSVGKRLNWSAGGSHDFLACAGGGYLDNAIGRLNRSGELASKTPGVALSKIQELPTSDQPLLLTALIDMCCSWNDIKPSFATEVRAALGSPPYWCQVTMEAALGCLAWYELSPQMRLDTSENLRTTLTMNSMSPEVRLSIAIRLAEVRPEAFRDANLLRELCKLYRGEIRPERSAVSSWTGQILKLLTFYPRANGGVSPGRNLVDAVDQNLLASVSGGHPDGASYHFSRDLVIAASATGSGATKRWKEKQQDLVRGDFECLLRMLAAGDPDFARDCLPQSGTSFWATAPTLEWTPRLDEQTTTFIAQVEKSAPTAALLLEAQTLGLRTSPQTHGGERSLSARAKQVRKRLLDHKATDQVQFVDALRLVCRFFPGDHELNQLIVLWMEGKNYRPLFESRVRIPGSGGDAYQHWKSVCAQEDLYLTGAIAASLRGNNESLHEIIEVLVDAGQPLSPAFNLGDPPPPPTQHQWVWQRLVDYASVRISTAIANSEEQGFLATADALAPAMRVSSNWYPPADECKDLAWILWHLSGNEHRFQQEARATGKNRGRRWSIQNSAALNLTLKADGAMGEANDPRAADSNRTSYLQALLVNPRADPLVFATPNWLDFMEMNGLSDVMNAILDASIAVRDPALPALALWEARQPGPAKTRELAFKRAIDLPGGPAGHLLKPEIKLEFAQFLKNEGRKAESRAVLDSISASGQAGVLKEKIQALRAQLSH